MLARLAILAALAVPVAISQQTSQRPLRYTDLHPALRAAVPGEGAFDEHIRAIDRRAADRLTEGEYDHLIFYMLQSGEFTELPRIEPARSAREFVESLKREDKTCYLAGDSPCVPEQPPPQAALRRMDDFVEAIQDSKSTGRLDYFRKILGSDANKRRVHAEYVRAMRFLFQKEFLSRRHEGQERRSYVASLYQERGHSSDSQVDANFAVWTAFSALQSTAPALTLNDVLVVGPGLDFAPRTSLFDAAPPQSYQPFAVADALLSLGLSNLSRLRIHCVDINPRVVKFLQEFPRLERTALRLFSKPGDEEYLRYFLRMGESIGSLEPLEAPEPWLGRSLTVSREVASRITARRMNIVTTIETPPGYDAVIATNVLLYFPPEELLLALHNIHAMLRPGGYLVHNDTRGEIETFTRPLGFGPIHARMIRLTAREEEQALFDAAVIHRKKAAE